MEQIENLMHQLQTYIPKHGLLNPKVSKGTVGWHIEHSLLTIRKIIAGVKASDPTGYKSSFNLKRFYVLNTGLIPRGKIQSPKVVTTEGELDAVSLKQSLLTTQNSLLEITGITENQFFYHPVLGQLNKKPTIKFLAVHTSHHLKIIKEIVGT